MKSLEELDIELCVFELKFNPAFLLWDSTGSIWSSMLQITPQLKLSTVLPNQQVFETESLQMVLELGLLRVNGRGPKPVEEVTKNASALTRIATEKLKVNSFTRAGFRLIRSKVFPTSATAMEFVPHDGSPESKAFGNEGRRSAFTRSSNYQTEKAGLLAALRVEEREWNFAASWEVRQRLPGKLSFKEWTVVMDSDYYTIGTVDRESFDVETWINQALKAIEHHWSDN